MTRFPLHGLSGCSGGKWSSRSYEKSARPHKTQRAGRAKSGREGLKGASMSKPPTRSTEQPPQSPFLSQKAPDRAVTDVRILDLRAEIAMSRPRRGGWRLFKQAGPQKSCHALFVTGALGVRDVSSHFRASACCKKKHAPTRSELHAILIQVCVLLGVGHHHLKGFAWPGGVMDFDLGPPGADQC